MSAQLCNACHFLLSYNQQVAVIEVPFGFVSSETVGGAGGTCVIR